MGKVGLIGWDGWAALNEIFQRIVCINDVVFGILIFFNPRKTRKFRAVNFSVVKMATPAPNTPATPALNPEQQRIQELERMLALTTAELDAAKNAKDNAKCVKIEQQMAADGRTETKIRRIVVEDCR